MNSVRRTVMIIVINAIVFIALMGAVELFYRVWRPSSAEANNGLWQNFHTYVMFLTAPGTYKSWTDQNTNQAYPANVVTNSLGFNDHHEFAYTGRYEKGPNERVVLFTGGSTGWGVGATSTDATVSGRMQFYLNSLQNAVKYTVINMSAGSWIAYQEFIALDLWGERFQPDWIVAMDGHNDASVGCQYSQGVANPLYFATIKSYVDAYLFSTAHPVFYRGWLENQLIRRSAAYRGLTGKEYVRNTQIFDQTSGEDFEARRQIIPTRLGAARDMLAFYLKAHNSMLKLYPDAQYILSTQPMLNEFTGDFVDVYRDPAGSEGHRQAAARREAVLEAYLTQHQDDWCSMKTAQPSFTYVYVNGAIQLERLVESAQSRGRKVEYHNMGTVLPNRREDRLPYFIDGAHLSDKGADVLGRFYADRILASGPAIR
jgi:lysophospholipase L1-like esterase